MVSESPLAKVSHRCFPIDDTPLVPGIAGGVPVLFHQPDLPHLLLPGHRSDQSDQATHGLRDAAGREFGAVWVPDLSSAQVCPWPGPRWYEIVDSRRCECR